MSLSDLLFGTASSDKGEAVETPRMGFWTALRGWFR
jgi:hypothetical protein